MEVDGWMWTEETIFLCVLQSREEAVEELRRQIYKLSKSESLRPELSAISAVPTRVKMCLI